MAIAEELHVKSLIQPYSNSIIQAIKEAWSLWLQSPFWKMEFTRTCHIRLGNCN